MGRAESDSGAWSGRHSPRAHSLSASLRATHTSSLACRTGRMAAPSTAPLPPAWGERQAEPPDAGRAKVTHHYLKQHALGQAMQQALNACLKDRPEDPNAFLVSRPPPPSTSSTPSRSRPGGLASTQLRASPNGDTESLAGCDDPLTSALSLSCCLSLLHHLRVVQMHCASARLRPILSALRLGFAPASCVLSGGCAGAGVLDCGAWSIPEHPARHSTFSRVCVCVCVWLAAQATYFERQERAAKQHLLREEVDKYLGPQVDTLKDFNEGDALELLLECVEDKHGVVMSDLYEFLGTLKPADAGASVAWVVRISLSARGSFDGRWGSLDVLKESRSRSHEKPASKTDDHDDSLLAFSI